MKLAWLALPIAALAPSLAWPCSPSWSWGRHAPTATSTVPRNTRLHLVGPLFTGTRVQVGPAAGPVGTATTTEIADHSLWQLSNVLQVHLPRVPPGALVRVTLRGDFAGPAHFELTPGTIDDLTPPRFTGTSTVYFRFESPVGTSNCVNGDHFVVWMPLAPAVDDFEVANYTMYETTGGQMRSLSSIEASRGSPSIESAVSPDEGSRCFAIVARDLAGNESAPLTACARLARPAAVDAGVADAGLGEGPMPGEDAGVAHDPGSLPLSAESCSTSSRGHGLTMLALLLLLGRRRSR